MLHTEKESGNRTYKRIHEICKINNSCNHYSSLISTAISVIQCILTQSDTIHFLMLLQKNIRNHRHHYAKSVLWTFHTTNSYIVNQKHAICCHCLATSKNLQLMTKKWDKEPQALMRHFSTIFLKRTDTIIRFSPF